MCFYSLSVQLSCLSKSTVKSTDSLSNEELDQIAITVAAEWERVATHLGVEQCEIDSIKRRSCSIYQKTFLVLHRWTYDCVNPQCRTILSDKLMKAGFGKIAQRMKNS